MDESARDCRIRLSSEGSGIRLDLPTENSDVSWVKFLRTRTSQSLRILRIDLGLKASEIYLLGPGKEDPGIVYHERAHVVVTHQILRNVAV
jgi:hypothetical protein